MSKEKVLGFNLPKDLKELLSSVKEITMPHTKADLLSIMHEESEAKGHFEVGFQVKGRGYVQEADVVSCQNGIVVNFTEPYMRRRDPKAMLIGDDLPTDKERFSDRYSFSFDSVRDETMAWFKEQEHLIVMPFQAGGERSGYPALLVAPANTAFFAAGVADLQELISVNDVPSDYSPISVIYVAPPFRHTHFGGKQVVVHQRALGMHEVFSFNLYPGPSAKKGVYGVLLQRGEDETEQWTTLHASTVRVIPKGKKPYVILHEGASGGGKSEMLEHAHGAIDRGLEIARNVITDKVYKMDFRSESMLHPITDDMALCHPNFQNHEGKLRITDGEDGWFLRVDHIKAYGTKPLLEELTIHPSEPLVFFNFNAQKGGTCLLWDHIHDAPGIPCSNPRVIVPRRMVEDIIHEPVSVDCRTFGVRTPPTYKGHSNYGIVGMLNVLTPELAWIWRLVAPRGHANPSIVGGEGLKSEGVGSYWPFATGKRVNQANILLTQIKTHHRTQYVLIPNQYIGAYHVGFAGEWLSREVLAQLGDAGFHQEMLEKSKCSLLGYIPKVLKVDGHLIPRELLHVEEQEDVGELVYKEGCTMLVEFFKKELSQYLTPELDSIGRQIIEEFIAMGYVSERLRVDQ